MNERNAKQLLDDIVNRGEYQDCARQAHETWKATKEGQGWKYGTNRDNEAKTNPLLVPFDELPEDLKGQNSLTPYAVVNYYRNRISPWSTRTVSVLDQVLQKVLDGQDDRELQQLGEYVHSHFVAAQLAKGDTVKTRKDLVVYEALDADTQSWDIASAKEAIRYIQGRIRSEKPEAPQG
jgi:hypothetical protein